MTLQPYYIANYDENSGLDTYYEPFLIPEKAFPVLENAYCWRGRVKKRLGYELLGRLRRAFTTVNFFKSAANWTFNLKVVNGYVIAADNANPGKITTSYPHGLSNGDKVVITGIVGATGYNNVTFTITKVDATNFTVGVDAGAFGAYVSGGFWISDRSLSATEPNAEIVPGSVVVTSNAITFTDQGDGTLTSATIGNSGTINYVTGAVALTFTGVVGSDSLLTYAYYPGLPVMGLPDYEQDAINAEVLYAFDTRYAYFWNGSVFAQLPSTPQVSWFGANYQLFWSLNYYIKSGKKLFWTTNNNAPVDPLRYYDGINWTTFEPAVITGGGTKLEGALILLAYKNRLLALNTYEGANLGASTNFPQRLRFSQNGDPTAADAWLQDTAGKGGYLDAPTSEKIISAEFIKDTLLVKFERSSWKIVYTGNELLPFVFQKINTELGSESTFSLVPFDRGVFSVANVGLTNDDSVNVARIDTKIPQTVFNFSNENNGVKRVYGIRDYNNELVFWSFPNAAQTPTFPNRMLIYNYINSSYAVFVDSFTALGYYNKSASSTWSNLTDITWADWSDPWDFNSTQVSYPDIIGGNQQGFVENLSQQRANDPSLAITSIALSASVVVLTVPNHNLDMGSFIKVTGILGNSTGGTDPSFLNDTNYKIKVLSVNTFSLEKYNSSDGLFHVVTSSTIGTYLGGGVITVISNFNISTKLFSFFYEVGAQQRLSYVDVLLDKTSSGELTCDCFVDECNSVPINDPNFPGIDGLFGDNIILSRPETDIPYQVLQQKIWHRIFINTTCQNFQLKLSMDDVQMQDDAINTEDITMHAMVLYLTKNSRLVQ